MNPKSGRGWAWAGFGLGITASVASNVFHSYLVAQGRTSLTLGGSLLLSAFWPVSLYICLEVMARVAWPVGFWYWAARYLGLGSVAAIAAYVSFRHMHGLLSIFGEESVITYAGPIGVDGLMLLSSSALIAVVANLRHFDRLSIETSIEPENRPEAVLVVPGRAEPAAITQPSAYHEDPLTAVGLADHLPAATKVITGPSELASTSKPKTDRGGDQLKAEAMQWVRDYTGDKTLTGKLLGEQFGRSETWGRERLREARSVT